MPLVWLGYLKLTRITVNRSDTAKAKFKMHHPLWLQPFIIITKRPGTKRCMRCLFKNASIRSSLYFRAQSLVKMKKGSSRLRQIAGILADSELCRYNNVLKSGLELPVTHHCCSPICPRSASPAISHSLSLWFIEFIRIFVPEITNSDRTSGTPLYRDTMGEQYLYFTWRHIGRDQASLPFPLSPYERLVFH